MRAAWGHAGSRVTFVSLGPLLGESRAKPYCIYTLGQLVARVRDPKTRTARLCTSLLPRWAHEAAAAALSLSLRADSSRAFFARSRDRLIHFQNLPTITFSLLWLFQSFEIRYTFRKLCFSSNHNKNYCRQHWGKTDNLKPCFISRYFVDDEISISYKVNHRYNIYYLYVFLNNKATLKNRIADFGMTI